MGTLIAVIAISFNAAHFPEAAVPRLLAGVHALAQGQCQERHPQGQAVPLRGVIGIPAEGGVRPVPAALFGCFIPDPETAPAPETVQPKAEPQALRRNA